MHNHLSQKFTLSHQTSKLNSTWKLALVLLGLSGIVPVFNAPAIAEILPTASSQLAQATPPSNSEEQVLMKVGVLAIERS